MKKYKFISQLSFLIFSCILISVLVCFLGVMIYIYLTNQGVPIYVWIITVVMVIAFILFLCLIVYEFSFVVEFEENTIVLKRLNRIIRKINIENIKDVFLVNCKYMFFVLVDDLVIPKKSNYTTNSSKNFIIFEPRKKSINFIKNILAMEYMKIDLDEYKNFIKFLQN